MLCLHILTQDLRSQSSLAEIDSLSTLKTNKVVKGRREMMKSSLKKSERPEEGFYIHGVVAHSITNVHEELCSHMYRISEK